MRRILWLLAGLALLAGGLYLGGRAPGEYMIEQEMGRCQETRRERYTLLAFHLAQGKRDDLPELRQQVDALLRETKTVRVRGWEVVLVPPGARAPGQGYRLALRKDVSIPADAPQLKGAMEAWTKPVGWLARLFASG